MPACKFQLVSFPTKLEMSFILRKLHQLPPTAHSLSLPAHFATKFFQREISHFSVLQAAFFPVAGAELAKKKYRINYVQKKVQFTRLNSLNVQYNRIERVVTCSTDTITQSHTQ